MEDLEHQDSRIDGELEPIADMVDGSSAPTPVAWDLPHLGFESREDEERAAAAFMSLSDREATVLAYLAHGLSAKEVAISLSVSSRTVDTFRTRALLKLRARNTADAVRILTTLSSRSGAGPDK
jgi:DNA-binding NarL/FixJ family response regulator